MKDSKTISTRISMGMFSDLQDHSDKINKQVSSILRDSIYRYLESRDDIELSEYNQLVVNNALKYEKAFNKQRYRELENVHITETMMENTFIEFMDNFIAQIFITNKPYKSSDELKQIMRDSLEALESRAKASDEVDAFEERKTSPIEYTEEFLDRKATEKQAFEDSDFSPTLH